MPAERYAPAIMERLAANVRTRREGLGLSLDALAARSGLGKTSLHKVEHARSPGVSLAFTATLAEALSLPIAALLDGESPITPDEAALLALLRERWVPRGAATPLRTP